MALPDGIQTVKITASTGFLADGANATAKAYVRPLHRVIHIATGSPLLPIMVEARAAGEGIEMDIPNDSQTGFIDGSGHAVTGWGYEITVRHSLDDGKTVDTVSKNVTFTPGQTTVDFDLVPTGLEPIDPVTGDFAVVTTINGLTGDVILEGGGGPSSWDELTGKPDSYPPSAHGHEIVDIEGLTDALDGAGVTSYNDLTDKPAIPTTPGDIGAQPFGDYVSSTDARLADARAPLAHGHNVADVTGLSAAIEAAGEPTIWSEIPGKPASFPPSAHSQAISTITGLQAELNGKQPAGSYATQGDLTTGLATKSDTGHAHAISDTAGLQDALDAASGGGGSPAWENITGKPVAFPPSAHFHTVDDVTGLQTMLDGKQSAGSYATTEQLTAGLAGKQPTGAYATTADLAGKQDAGDYVEATDARLSDARTPTAHEHAVGDVTGLQSALDAKQASGSYATASELTNGLASKQNIGDYIEEGDTRLYDSRTPTAHSHTWAEVTGKPATFTPNTHSHTISDTTGLQTALDGKQVSGSYATSSDLTTGLAGKANTSHTHTIANTTGLQAALDAKGTSNLALGTSSSTAKAGNYTPPVADLPAGTTITVMHTGSAWPARPTSRTDVTVIWVGGTTATPPPGESTTDLWFKATI